MFVPILNVVSTASADILDTIQCFSTLLSLATPNQEMFFTQIHLVNDSKKLRLRRAKIVPFSFMLVYRTHLGKHKTLKLMLASLRQKYSVLVLRSSTGCI